jgi:hypothetical protein
MTQRSPAVAVLFALGLLVSCGSPTASSTDAIVTFRVANETFRVRLTTAAQLGAARAAQTGGRVRIPVGRILAGTHVNTGWSWHLEQLEFVEATIELCDGLPSDVERAGPAFGGGTYCPWSATIESIEG